MLKGIEFVKSRISELNKKAEVFYETFDIHAMDLFINCDCGKKAFDTDDEQVMDMAFEEFGSLDDLHIFKCECGQLQAVHYTGFDSILEGFEFSAQMNDTTRLLGDNGSYCLNNNYNSVEAVQSIFNDYELLHTIYSYEIVEFYKKGNSIVMVEYNSVHSTLSVFDYTVKDMESAMVIFNHFKGECK